LKDDDSPSLAIAGADSGDDSSAPRVVERDDRGRFLKGTGGRPKGHWRSQKALAELCRGLMAEHAENVLRSMLTSRSWKARLAALEFAAERGFGKAPQTIDLEVGAGQTLEELLYSIQAKSAERRRRLAEPEPEPISIETRCPTCAGPAGHPPSPGCFEGALLASPNRQ
jgi:hypothetical protein